MQPRLWPRPGAPGALKAFPAISRSDAKNRTFTCIEDSTLTRCERFGQPRRNSAARQPSAPVNGQRQMGMSSATSARKAPAVSFETREIVSAADCTVERGPVSCVAAEGHSS